MKAKALRGKMTGCFPRRGQERRRTVIIHEYGADKTQTVMLLHGGGLSWWNYREAAELLQDDCRVILPILDGHAGSDRSFTSIKSSAEEILAFIDGELGGSVTLLGGLSLGAQVLLEALALRDDLCRFALVESASLLPSKITRAMIGPAVASSYGLVKDRRFAELQFRSLHMKPELFEEYYRDSCAITKRDMIAFLEASTAYPLRETLARCRAELHIFVGEKESRAMRKSAELLQKTAPRSSLTVLPGLYHGEFSLNHARDYAQTVRKLLQAEADGEGKRE